MTARSGKKATPVVRAGPAVTRAMAILRCLSRSPHPVGVNAIARELDIIPSTCLHILRALAAEGMVAFDPETKLYTLDVGVLTLARNALSQDAFARIAQSELDDLAGTLSVTAIGVRVIGLKHMVVAAMSRSEAAFRLHVDIGSRFPALISATGRCLAAFGGHSGKEIERGFKLLRWERAPGYAAWKQEVAATRRSGVGIDKGNYIRGVTIFAAPVMGFDGGMTHALVAIALSDQLPAARAAAIGSGLKAAAARVSARLGGARESA
ncbi:MAG: IclR family transcriptional regulator [Hyphomicrobiaceae bacterium]